MAWFEKDHFGHLRGPSDRLASWFDWTTPNLVTLFGALLVAPMTWAFWNEHTVIGLGLFLAGIFTDVLDGPLARYQEANMTETGKVLRDLRNPLFRRGQTSGGSAFDPFVDKLRYFGALLPLGWYLLWWPMMATSVAFALLITVARLFVKAKANKFGKIKAIAEAVLIAVLALHALVIPNLHLDHLTQLNDTIVMLANVILTIATVLGGLSFAGQAYTWLKRKNASS